MPSASIATAEWRNRKRVQAQTASLIMAVTDVAHYEGVCLP